MFPEIKGYPPTCSLSNPGEPDWDRTHLTCLNQNILNKYLFEALKMIKMQYKQNLIMIRNLGLQNSSFQKTIVYIAL